MIDFEKKKQEKQGENVNNFCLFFCCQICLEGKKVNVTDWNE